jgi:hypothetical protein
MLIEIDPARVAPSGPMASPVNPSDELRDAVGAIGVEPLRRLVRALAADLAGPDDRPRAIELVGAINRLIEASGLSLDRREDAGMPASPRPAAAGAVAASEKHSGSTAKRNSPVG